MFAIPITGLWAQGDTVTHYTKKEVMVTMRDGVKLFTRIYIPEGVNTPLPILLMRSPYADWNIGVKSPENDSYVKDMAREGYIFVYQNIRGKQKSEGDFIMEGAFDKNNNQAIDEASDTYDLIEWLLHNVNSNGRVGQLGISYPGELALISAVKPHPALKAVSPQGTVGDFFKGDDYFHNGAFRLSFGFEYAYAEGATRGDTSFPFAEYDLYEWYLKLGPLSNVNKNYFHHKIAAWNDFVEHPNYDKYWSTKAPVNYSDTPLVPILHVGGYWDQENLAGPQMLYAKMEHYDKKQLNYLVLGPWSHGQWSDSNASKIGEYVMGRNTALEFRRIQKQWFDHWLKGTGDGNFDEATCYQTGSNIWKSYKSWPDNTAKKKDLYLNNDLELSFTKPHGQCNLHDSYISDPENPVVYRYRPIEVTYSDSSNWESWLTQDQRLVNHRPDVISYRSAPLKEDLTVTGNVIADIFASTTGTDADWVVKLIDVNPDYDTRKPDISEVELIIAADIFRARFRKSFSKPSPLCPGKVEEYKFSLHQINHVFKKGHRIMVQVQSTWFPIFDRNPQKFVPNIFMASKKDFIRSTQSIYHSRRYPSHIELPVVGDGNTDLSFSIGK